MKKIFGVLTSMAMALALFVMPVNALTNPFVAKIGDKEYVTLQDAVNDAADGDKVELIQNVDLESGTLAVNKAIILSGGENKYTIESTATNVIQVLSNVTSLDGKVVLEHLTIKGTNAGKTSRAIGLGGSQITQLELDVNDCEIYTTQRGITVNANNNSNIKLNVNNTFISLTNNIKDYDKEVNSTNNYENSRGISLWQMGNSQVNINNSTIQGFFYDINNAGGTGDELTVTMENSTFKGRCAINAWQDGTHWIIRDSKVHGINNFGGKSESFATIVLNENATNNVVEIEDTVFTTYFNETGLNNPNAKEYLLSLRDSSSTVVIKGDKTSYTCPEDKGGIVQYSSTSERVDIYGGSYSYDATDYLAEGYGSYLMGEKYVVAPKATGITLDKSELTLNLKDKTTDTLIETVDPSNTLDTVTWSTSDTTVATVDQTGKVTAVKEGTATIKATVNGKEATCTVTVLGNRTVTFDNEGTKTTATVVKGEKVAEPTAPTKDGYTFVGWYNGKEKYDFTKPVTKDLTLTAEWKVVPGKEEVEVPTIDPKEPVEEVTIGVANQGKTETILTESIKDETLKEAIEEKIADGIDVNTVVNVDLVKPEETSEEVKKDIEKVIAAAKENNVEVAQYLDINIKVMAGDEELGKITTTTEKLTFQVAVPEELKKEGRTFIVIRVHDGKVEELKTVEKDGMLTFETDKFSTYALTYKDVEPTKPATKPTTPDTSDMSMIINFGIMAILSGMILVVLKKKESLR